MNKTSGILLLVTLFAVGCDKTVTEPSTTPTTTPTNESFEATLLRGESMFYSFSVGTAGTVTVTLASVVQQGRAAALTTPLRVGVGTPVGEGCEVSDSVDASAALTPQLTATMTVGIHCVYVADVGQIPGTVIVAVRFSHL